MKHRPGEKKLWDAFSLYIRLRDSDENGYCTCFTCGRVDLYKYMDCGHGIGRQHLGVKYNEKNNHAQCKVCNGFEGGKREMYKIKMDEKYGKGTWELMEVLGRKPSKMGRFEFEQLAVYYTNKVKELKRAII